MSASDAPRRDPGLRTRSGNAMLRTRAALLDAVEACVADSGVRRTTMSDIAARGGVAKATLYNHFRTKDDVLAALVEARVAELAEACAERSPVEALEHATAVLRDNRALRRVAQDEPALLVPLAVEGEGRVWEQVRAALERVAGPARAELVLRWLVSQLLWPVGPETARAQSAALAGGEPTGASPLPVQGRPEGSAGLGWPGGPARLRTR